MASTETESVNNNNKNPDKKADDIIPGFATIEEFTKHGFSTLMEATRNSNSLPQDRDWGFYNTHQSFRNLMSNQGTDILHLINHILRQQGVHGNISHRDVDEKIELIVEANDVILERVANNLDELAGIKSNPALPVEIQTVSAQLPINGSWNKLTNATFTVSSQSSATKSTAPVAIQPRAIRLLTAKNIQRPQASFKDKIDNSRLPWTPRIKDKPNSLKPLAIYVEESDDGRGEVFSHPYELELERFEPAADTLTYVKPISPRPLADTPLRMVSTPEALDALLADLRKYEEFAVDLEHHSYRTFLGITCLMQISTVDTDYIIDTFTLRDKLELLNEVFTKPTIVKVFHGADHDVEWLQRDLCLYVVNMFDTHQAAKQLGYAQLSLAYLLRKFCQVDANKHFQLADWRIRPLPEELKSYAREDTHYLLYIYHKMRNELLNSANRSANVLRSVIQASTNVCRRRYMKPVLHDDSHLELYRRCRKLFDNRQMYALKHVYAWRDETGRQEDESTGYVLPNHMMLQIAELLPREMQGILACCNPIPPLVRANLLDLHKIILRARDQAVVKPILSEEARSRGSTQHAAKFNIDNPLHCPHDLSKCEEFRDDLPTLLADRFKQREAAPARAPAAAAQPHTAAHNKLMKKVPALCVFEQCDSGGDDDGDRRNTHKIIFLGPYDRYKLVKSYIQAQHAQERTQSAAASASTAERTDEDRISALHKHFIQASTIAPQARSPDPAHEVLAVKREQPPTLDADEAPVRGEKFTGRNVPLRAMKGTKRKRPMFEAEASVSRVKHNVAGAEDTVLRSSVQTPVPNLQHQPQVPDALLGMSKTQLRKLKKSQRKLNQVNKKQTFLEKYDQYRAQFTDQTVIIITPNNCVPPPQQQQQQQQPAAAAAEGEEKPVCGQNEINTSSKCTAPPQQQQQQQRQVPQEDETQTGGTNSTNTPPPPPPPPQQQQGQKKNRARKRKAKQLQIEEDATPQIQHTQPTQKQRNKRKAVQEPETSNTSSQRQLQQQQHPRGGKKKKRHEKDNGDDNWQPFNYSAVDFQQFQGGAGSAHKPKDVRSNFKSRGQRNKKFQNIGRNNTRSSTFGGNRGRGGGGGNSSRGGVNHTSRV